MMGIYKVILNSPNRKIETNQPYGTLGHIKSKLMLKGKDIHL